MKRTIIGGLLLLASGGSLRAQDVELAARGRPVPAAYYERIAREPDFFEGTRGWRQRTQFALQSQLAVRGNLPVAVIQALFVDSPEPTITPAQVREALFDGPAPYGTLTEFYREISRGNLTVTGQVSPWVRTQITRAATVGTSMGLGADAQVGTFLVQALQAADPHLDFGRFDNDGPDGVPNSGDDDGYVDAVAFQFIERAASCGGDGIWPHRSRISGWGTQTGGPWASADLRPNGQRVLVNDYIVQSTVACAGGMQTASVVAHELGHVLGLPDLYHAANGIQPSQRRWVIGCWTLMAAGSWGCGDGSTHGSAPRPSHMGPWEKAQLGWITEEVVGTVRDQEYVLEPVQTSGRSLRIPLSATEYLQVEYRPRTGFDLDLPASGVLVYHIEPGRPLYPTVGAPRLYRVALKEADGDSALVRTSAEGGNRGVASDAWAVSGATRLDNLTNPNAKRNSGLPSTVTIHSITVAGGVARVRVTTAATPALRSAVPPLVAMAAASHALTASGGALPYQWVVESGVPAGLVVAGSGDTLRVTGKPLESGTFTVSVRVTDALGTVTTLPVALTVAPVAIAPERLLQPFLASGAAPLGADEIAYLDAGGNRNGKYDVGDLRRRLRTPAP